MKPGAALHTLPSLIKSVGEPFPPAALRRRHAKTVRDSSSSYRIDYIRLVKTSLNPKGHQHHITSSKVKAILLDGGTLPIVEVASGRV